VAGFCEHGNETLVSIKGGEFFLLAEPLLASQEVRNWLVINLKKDEAESGTFLRNVDYGVTTRKTTFDIFTSVRTPNFRKGVTSNDHNTKLRKFRC
jgi:hypothetical protein